MAEDDEKGYTWETEYERTWEVLTEDDEGLLQASIDSITHREKRRHLQDRPGNIRLGMMRHLFLVLDMSVAMEDQDLKPNRLRVTLKLVEHFIEEFFDQNPISQLGVIVTCNKRAEKITELGGNPKRHIAAVNKLRDRACQGEPSLQNSLEVCLQTLRHMPSHASREVLILFGCLTTCDPGDIHNTIRDLQSHNIRVSIIGLAAEVKICRQITKDTKGDYGVILDDVHYRDLLTRHVIPPPATINTESSLIRMGFPHHSQADKDDKPSMCMCHLDSKDGCQFSLTGYFCPQCKSKYCELPVECKVCGLTLVSAPHLARSYHHLFPLDAYIEVSTSNLPHDQKRICFACQVQTEEQAMYRCEKCDQYYCIDCDLFVHETLHSCPGCASSRATQQLIST